MSCMCHLIAHFTDGDIEVQGQNDCDKTLGTKLRASVFQHFMKENAMLVSVLGKIDWVAVLKNDSEG